MNLLTPLFISLLISVSAVQAQDSSATHKEKGADLMAVKAYAQAAQELSLAVEQATPEDKSDCLCRLASAYQKLGKIEEAKKCMDKVLADTLKWSGIATPNYITAMDNLSVILLDSAEYESAEKNATKTLDLAKDVIGKNNLQLSALNSSLARAYFGQKKFQDAERLSKNAMTIAETLVGDEHWVYGRMYFGLAKCFYKEGKVSETQTACEKIIPIFEKKFGRDHEETAEVCTLLAKSYAAQKNTSLPERYFKRALFTVEQAVGLDAPQVADTLADYAEYLKKLGRTKESEVLTARAKSIRQHPHEVTATEVSLNLKHIAFNRANAAGDSEKAEGILQEMLKISEMLPEKHAKRVMTLCLIGTRFVGQGRYLEAEPYFKKAYTQLEPIFGMDHPPVSQSIFELLGGMSASKGDLANAEHLYDEELAVIEELFGSDCYAYANVLENLAQLYQMKGDKVKALAFYERGLVIHKKHIADENVPANFSKQAKLYLQLLHDVGKDSQAADFKTKYQIED